MVSIASVLMLQLETIATEWAFHEDAQSAESSRNLQTEFAAAIGEILTPDGNGNVRFGAKHEVLRLSQVEAMTAIRDCVLNDKKIGHVVQPGGTGKTREGIAAAYAMHSRGRNTLYVVPSQQAVEDFARKARDLCPDMDVGTIYQIEKRIGRLTFITYASLLRYILGENAETEARTFENQQNEDRTVQSPAINKNGVVIDPANYDLIIWDEAHKYLTANAQKLVARFARQINIALTATPRYYEGKEVAHVFGEKLHELDLKTAVERKEISDFRNLLIATDVTTGLELTSPDQEESAEVARAIDVPNRNNIFPDLYRNAKIRIGDKEFTLTGEPAIVFGAGINHVHDLAQAFNDSLTESLHADEAFRAALRAKGIDPDSVERIAAPIHSGGSDDHAPMPLDERNALVDMYHRRKVLILTATSVLQQSFDSPMTSVVIDTVPRQTYVGVGQAGMRALRWLPNKEMACIINTQDSDHPSLTFLDFQAVRGREEGISVEIGHANKTGMQKHKTAREIADYNVIYGVSLIDLAERRKAQRNQLYRDDFDISSRHFTPLGYQKINQLMLDMVDSNQQMVNSMDDKKDKQVVNKKKQQATNEFVKTIQIWIARIKQFVASQIFGKMHVDEDLLEDAAIDTIMSLIKAVQSGKVCGWYRFAVRFHNELLRRYQSIRRRIEQKRPQVSLRETMSWNDRKVITRIDADLIDLPGDIEKAWHSLTQRECEIVKLRYGFADGNIHTYKKIGKLFGVSREYIRQVDARAVRKLQQPENSQPLLKWLNLESDE